MHGYSLRKQRKKPKKKNGYSPAENTENEVHYEEGSEDDHGHKVDELPSIPL